MKTFDHVEDYLEVVAGVRDIVTNKLNNSIFISTFEPIISLARYDTDVLKSMSEQAIAKQALTERQGELACKILLKYQRQLASKQVDVTPIETPKWRVPLRKMDYTKRVSIENDTVILRFPYSTALITSVREFTKDSQGFARWNREQKYWELALTEYNLSWVHSWAQINQFEIDASVAELFGKIEAMEATEYAIELTVNDGNLEITNAPDSMIAYINDYMGGLGIDNLIKLVDSSSLLGYTINADLESALIAEYGHRFVRLATNKEIKISPNTLISGDDFESVIKYAVDCGRLPIVLYEPDLSDRMLSKIQDIVNPDSILVVGNNKNPEIDPAHKVIHTHKPLKNLNRIPMLISSAGMVFGGDKQIMLQRAEKVVFCAADVYNTGQDKKKVKHIAG